MNMVEFTVVSPSCDYSQIIIHEGNNKLWGLSTPD